MTKRRKRGASESFRLGELAHFANGLRDLLGFEPLYRDGRDAAKKVRKQEEEDARRFYVVPHAW